MTRPEEFDRVRTGHRLAAVGTTAFLEVVVPTTAKRSGSRFAPVRVKGFARVGR